MDIKDIFIIGGGINGCGIARDAAGRGYSVTLAEARDLASATSSASTKLIHGGLRYLEHYEFRLVREALIERERILGIAPHIAWPLRFVLPHHKGLRPAWLLRLGLFLYDSLGGRKILPATKRLDLRKDAAGVPLKDAFTLGFEYSDGWIEDARLVSLNAQDAVERGAEVLTYSPVTEARMDGDHWLIQTTNPDTGESRAHRARLLINAAGPFVDDVLGQVMRENAAKNVRLVRGSHIVVPKIHDHDRAYILQNSDERILFAIPYQQDFTLIGTTDADHAGSARDAVITDAETEYLCREASEYFKAPVSPEDVVWTYSGVRPLYDDGATAAQEATRDYVIRPETDRPLINIFGGKLTTYRKLAEAVMTDVTAKIGAKGASWTGDEALPGGNFPVLGFDTLVHDLEAAYPFAHPKLVYRLARAYGTHARTILGEATEISDLGTDFGAMLHEAEVDYLITHEFARTAEDILWRRSKLGLSFPTDNVAQLDAFVKDRVQNLG